MIGGVIRQEFSGGKPPATSLTTEGFYTFVNQLPVRFEPATGDVKLCGIVLDVDPQTGKTRHIERLRIDLEEA